MNSKLMLAYEFSDSDDFGWLIAEVQTPSFSGRNGMWVQWQDVGDFAALLSTYPITADKPVVEEWGFTQQGEHTEITKIGVAPRGTTGGLIVDIALTNYYSPLSRCRAQFETDYPALAIFREGIERMMQDRIGSAVLHGSTDIR